jgi:hypothetical protein
MTPRSLLGPRARSKRKAKRDTFGSYPTSLQRTSSRPWITYISNPLTKAMRNIHITGELAQDSTLLYLVPCLTSRVLKIRIFISFWFNLFIIIHSRKLTKPTLIPPPSFEIRLLLILTPIFPIIKFAVTQKESHGSPFSLSSSPSVALPARSDPRLHIYGLRAPSCRIHVRDH